MNTSEIIACRGSQSLVFPPIVLEDGGIGSKQLKCEKQGQDTQAQCTLNKPIFCPNNGETLGTILNLHEEKEKARLQYELGMLIGK